MRQKVWPMKTSSQKHTQYSLKQIQPIKIIITSPNHKIKPQIKPFTNQSLKSMSHFCRKNFFSSKTPSNKSLTKLSKFTTKCIRNSWKSLKEFKNNNMKSNPNGGSTAKIGQTSESNPQIILISRALRKMLKINKKSKPGKTIKKYFLETKTSILSLKSWLEYKCPWGVSVGSSKSSSKSLRISTLNTLFKWITVILAKMTSFTLLQIIPLMFSTISEKSMESVLNNTLAQLALIKWCRLWSWERWLLSSN